MMLPMITGLFYLAESATAAVCLTVATGIFLVARMPWVFRKPKRILAIFIAGVLLLGSMQLVFNVNLKGKVISQLGRNEDLTRRVPMWNYLKSLAGDPLIGVGYESFWVGSRIEKVWQKFKKPINQAHNGYLELYLNLGYIGLAIMICNILFGLLKISKHLAADFPSGILKFSFIIVVVLYNYTEATFFGMNNMWLLFWLGVMVIPGTKGLESERT
jgi:O-antigen ligase